MAIITVTIETNDDAFNHGQGPEYETARILKKLSLDILDTGLFDRNLRDINGKIVGACICTGLADEPEMTDTVPGDPPPA